MRRRPGHAHRLSARHGGDFCPRGRASGRGPCVIRPAFACLHPSRPADKAAEPRSGPGRLPEASRVRGCEPRPQAPHPTPLQERLMKRPSSDRMEGNIIRKGLLSTTFLTDALIQNIENYLRLKSLSQTVKSSRRRSANIGKVAAKVICTQQGGNGWLRRKKQKRRS